MTPISGSFGGASRRGFGMTGKAKVIPLAPTSVSQVGSGTSEITSSVYIPEAANTTLSLYLNGTFRSSVSLSGVTQPGTRQTTWSTPSAAASYSAQFTLTRAGVESPLSTAVTMWSGPPQTYWNSLTFSGSTTDMSWYADGFQRFKITRDGTVIYQPGYIEYGGTRYYSDTPPSNPGGTNSYAISNSIGASAAAGQGLWFSTPYAQSITQPWKPVVTSVSASGFGLNVTWDFGTSNPPSFTVYADEYVSFDGGDTYNYYPVSPVTVSGSARSATLYIPVDQGGSCPAYSPVAVYANSAAYPDPGYDSGAFTVYC
jgi:hypothetical protein